MLSGCSAARIVDTHTVLRGNVQHPTLLKLSRLTNTDLLAAALPSKVA